MVDESLIGRILMRLVAASPHGLTACQLLDSLRCEQANLQRTLRWMVIPHEPHGCLVTLHHCIYRIEGCRNYDAATGGWGWIAAAIERPALPTEAREWITEALTGMTDEGERSGILRAAVPTREIHVSRWTAEERAHQSNKRLNRKVGK
jgi:hypothetical protein